MSESHPLDDVTVLVVLGVLAYVGYRIVQGVEGIADAPAAAAGAIGGAINSAENSVSSFLGLGSGDGTTP